MLNLEFVFLTCNRSVRIGACAMTTEVLDNSIYTFKIAFVMAFPKRSCVFGRFSISAPKPRPLKSANFILSSSRRL